LKNRNISEIKSGFQDQFSPPKNKNVGKGGVKSANSRSYFKEEADFKKRRKK